ncbi:MAG TPA: VWA domain-containing protein [Gaiellaceae bacterium]|nr:VWA domain-containing protein [Gaiellaceae bacterium]
MRAFELTFLSPLGALACLAAILPLAAVAFARRRAGRAAAAIGLPEHRRGRGRLLVLVAACCAFGLAAAQPVISLDDGGEVRDDVEALFVLDVSRSMLAARGPADPTRLERARNAALELRAAIPEVRAGLAGLTDRALPYLFPTLDQGAFASTLRDAVAAESPPPQQVARVATSFDALAGLGTRGFFTPNLDRRVCVIITDGESAPFSGPAAGCRLVVVQLWDAAERVYRDGEPEPQYRPDDAAPAAAAKLGPVAREGDLGRARELLASAVGDGPASAAAAGERKVALAPYLALAGILLVLGLVFGRPRLPDPRGVRTMVEA